MDKHDYLFNQIFSKILNFDKPISKINKYYETNVVEYVKPEPKPLN